jgi:hypothetical protein
MKYQKPELHSFTQDTKHGACTSGTYAKNCTAGSSDSEQCNTGSGASGGCDSGNSPVYSCTQGNSASHWCGIGNLVKGGGGGS